MTTIEHLRNAPIVEALVDIRVKLPPDVDVIKLESIGGLISNQYPKKKKRIRFEGKFDVKVGELPRHNDTPVWVDGHIYSTEDERYMVQTRLDGFTFSRLSPYETWENLRDEAYKLWEHYVRITSPEIITRVALRYINRLEFPFPMGDFNEYLTSSPIIPEGLPQKISSFLVRVVVPEESIKSFAIITQSFKSVERDKVPVILDIDVFKQMRFEVDKKEAWDFLEKLHEFKNKVFFKSITEKTKELYK